MASVGDSLGGLRRERSGRRRRRWRSSVVDGWREPDGRELRNGWIRGDRWRTPGRRSCGVPLAREASDPGAEVYGSTGEPRAAARAEPSGSGPKQVQSNRGALRNKAFHDAYVAARASFIAGLRDALFPAGTYWLRRFASATCAAGP